MKIGKWLVVLLVAALIAAYAFIGSDYSKQRRQNNTLAVEITAAQTSLAGIPAAPTDVAAKLAAAQADLIKAEAFFNADTDETHIVNAVLQTANVSGVSAIPLGTLAWTQETIANRVYRVFRINLQATGSFEQLKDFVSRLESGDMKTLVIESIKVDKVADENAPVSANLQVALYALPPEH